MRNPRRVAVASAVACVIAATAFAASASARGRHHARPSPDKPHAEFESRVSHFTLPFELPGGQYAPVAWSEIPGWADDDQLAAYKTFLVSCKSILATRKPAAADSKAIGDSLRAPCEATKTATVTDAAAARAFFEAQFTPLRISRLGEPEGFVTGYYEPIIDGSRTPTDIYNVPVYRRPSNLFVRGTTQATLSLPNKGDVFRKIGRRKLVPYHDRAAIEDGAIAGRGLEIVWLKSQTDLLFTQIQGSARVKLDDGSTVRINYEAHNGFPYTPVGRILIDRQIIPREQMSMQRIRQWMAENPDGGNELRRQNKSYVFFREVQLSDADEAVGAQGVPLTPNRSIAVDRLLHVYGTPFFIEGELPIETDTSKTPFRRLMIGQDTGSAIVGPARADIYLGAGAEAGKVAGRLKNPARFVMLVPKALDPTIGSKTIALPRDRPSATIAKLLPATPGTAPIVAPAVAPPVTATTVEPPKVEPAKAVPLPQARPTLEPVRVKRVPPRRPDRHHRSRPAKPRGWFW
ncbi:MAG: rane-bound lytic murein transglycosylase [Tardiphaga sp.]|nr:rane-bound lytic murein transglycosylase [Tardiphaga sp.]